MRWVFRAALWLLPASFRRRYAADLIDAYDVVVADAARRGAFSRWRAAWSCLGDVLRRLPAEHARALHLPNLRESFTMSFGFELRQALRALMRQPAPSLLVIFMLTLGVAANTTVFSVVNTLFLRPLPWTESGRLVYVNERAPRWNLEFTGINYPDYLTWREQARAFEGIALYDPGAFNLADGSSAERVEGLRVTYNFFDVLRVRPIMGRAFLPEEDKPGGPAVVLISEEMWRTRFGGRADVLGMSIRLESRPTTIVGVVPRLAGLRVPADVWAPIQGDPAQPYQSYEYDGLGRLKPGVTLEQARADLARAHTPIWEAYDSARTVSPRVDFLRDHFVSDFRLLAFALAGGVAIVLLIACANVSSVMLARATARDREMGIRRALGAGGGRIARHLLMENALLALVGTALGVTWGYWTIRTMSTLLPDGLPPWMQLSPDARLFGFAAVVAVTTALVSGIAPMAQAARDNVQSALTADANGRASRSRAQKRTLNALVVAEVALAFLLLVGGGLFLRAFARVQNVDPGFDTRNVLTYRVSLPWARYSDVAVTRTFYQRLNEKLNAIPGVQSSAVVSRPPFGGHQGNFIQVEGIPERTAEEGNPVVLVRWASHDYARTMGLRLKSGRFFSERDDLADSARVIVVNETLARTFLPNANIVGRRIRFGSDGPWRTVVGVVGDIKHYGLDQPMRPGVYLPMSGVHPSISMTQAVKTTVTPLSLAANVRTIMRELDPELPVIRLTTIEEELDRSLVIRRTYSWVLAVFATVALLLAVGGIYGVLSYVVGQRRREIGIRIALGAQRANVLRLVLGQGIMVALLGIMIGLAAALPVSKYFASLLYGITARDPLTYIGVAAVLTLTVLVAALVPARRALTYQPQTILRE